MASLGARHGWAAAIYYGLFNSAFRREQQSVLSGQQAYHESLSAPTGTMALLRRNTHRLEKGLLMRPRKLPFALDYLGETVRAFSVAHRCKGMGIDEKEIAWANDVLFEYFSIHEGVEAVARDKELFLSTVATTDVFASRGGKCIPYARNLTAPLSVNYPQLLALARHRRSVRWFRQEAVERQLIDNALEIGAQSPSACNRQPFLFRIFDDASIIKQLARLPMGMGGWGHNVPVLVVVLGQQRHYYSERDRHLIYIDASLAVTGFLYGLEVQGLSSCCVNWADIEDREARMERLLKLQGDERPIMLIAVGYADPEGLVAFSSKKSLSQLRRYNFE